VSWRVGIVVALLGAGMPWAAGSAFGASDAPELGRTASPHPHPSPAAAGVAELGSSATPLLEDPSGGGEPGSTAGRLGPLRLLALSPGSGVAVIARSGGELLVVRPGEPLPGTGAVVTGILPDRVELELDRGPHAGAGGLPLRVWLLRADPGGAEPSRVVTLDPAPPPPPPRLSPQFLAVDSKARASASSQPSKTEPGSRELVSPGGSPGDPDR